MTMSTGCAAWSIVVTTLISVKSRTTIIRGVPGAGTAPTASIGTSSEYNQPKPTEKGTGAARRRSGSNMGRQEWERGEARWRSWLAWEV